jgi:hypothetical protein
MGVETYEGTSGEAPPQVERRVPRSKTCPACNLCLPLRLFYRDPSRHDGRSRFCPKCHYAKRADRPPRVRPCPYCQAPITGKGRIQCLRCAEAKTLANKRAQKSSRRRAIGRPVADYAREAVRQAVRAGLLKRDHCIVCGSVERLHLHHVNGTERLEDWFRVACLCDECHTRAHAVIAIAEFVVVPGAAPAEPPPAPCCGLMGEFVVPPKPPEKP